MVKRGVVKKKVAAQSVRAPRVTGSVVRRTKKAAAAKTAARGKATRKVSAAPLREPKRTVKKLRVSAGAKAVGEVSHYFPRIQVAVVKLAASLSAGDEVRFKGHTTNFTQKIMSIQIDHVSLEAAKAGDEIGVQVESRVRIGDSVTRV